jgi:hypothetical protein
VSGNAPSPSRQKKTLTMNAIIGGRASFRAGAAAVAGVADPGIRVIALLRRADDLTTTAVSDLGYAYISEKSAEL